MGAVAQAYYDKVPARRPGSRMLRRWTVIEEGKGSRCFFSAETALRCFEVRKEAGALGLRFGWNLPAKKAQGCNPEPMEMAELIENCGIQEARKIMNAEL